jgi:hypothetical protein
VYTYSSFPLSHFAQSSIQKSSSILCIEQEFPSHFRGMILVTLCQSSVVRGP